MFLAARGAACAARNSNKDLLRAAALLSSRVGGTGSGGDNVISMANDALAMATTLTSAIGATQHRAKTDLSVLHHPSLVDVCIIGAVRTPIGGLLGSLSSLSATELGGEAIKAALRAARIGSGAGVSSSSSSSSLNDDSDVIDEVIMGNVLSAGLGQAPATQAAALAGLPATTPAYTVNKVCASGMKAVALAASSISTGAADVVVAGGMESMSNAPFYLEGSRSLRRGVKLGSLGEIVDGMMVDGLMCALTSCVGDGGVGDGGVGDAGVGGGEREGDQRQRKRNLHMGEIADAAAAEAGVSREDQDWYALLSHARARRAAEDARAAAEAHARDEERNGDRGGGSTSCSYYAWHGPEVVPIRVPKVKKGDKNGEKASSSSPCDDFDLVTDDDARSRLDEARLLTLPPAFGPRGTATAGNASPISDGAAALVLCSSSAAAMRGARVLAHVAATADAQLPADKFPFAPAEAAWKALARAGVKSAKDVDLWEINEAFASVVLATARRLGISSREEVEAKVNVAGGAVSLGHPLGASGAAAVVRLAHAMAARNAGLGVATICNGGGGATAVVLRRSVREDGEPDDDDDADDGD